MSETKLAMITAATGILTTVTAWFMGGKQAAKTSNHDSITRGADAIVDSTNKLLSTFQRMAESEKQHRENCEKSLAEHKVLINDLRKEINMLKKKL